MSLSAIIKLLSSCLYLEVIGSNSEKITSLLVEIRLHISIFSKSTKWKCCTLAALFYYSKVNLLRSNRKKKRVETSLLSGNRHSGEVTDLCFCSLISSWLIFIQPWLRSYVFNSSNQDQILVKIKLRIPAPRVEYHPLDVESILFSTPTTLDLNIIRYKLWCLLASTRLPVWCKCLQVSPIFKGKWLILIAILFT